MGGVCDCFSTSESFRSEARIKINLSKRIFLQKAFDDVMLGLKFF